MESEFNMNGMLTNVALMELSIIVSKRINYKNFIDYFFLI